MKKQYVKTKKNKNNKKYIYKLKKNKNEYLKDTKIIVLNN
jgi:hypothetical protein